MIAVCLLATKTVQEATGISPLSLGGFIIVIVGSISLQETFRILLKGFKRGPGIGQMSLDSMVSFGTVAFWGTIINFVRYLVYVS